MRRRDFNGRVLTIRAEDLKVLALMLETTPASLQRRLAELGLFASAPPTDRADPAPPDAMLPLPNRAALHTFGPEM